LIEGLGRPLSTFIYEKLGFLFVGG
jgi:hypothetical protein